MQDKSPKRHRGSFSFRLKMGEYEVEISGRREDVLETIRDLPNMVTNIDKAFEKAKPKKVTTLTVKTEAPSAQKASSQKYPQILSSKNLDEAILKLLETDWGKWRPRTVEELGEALKSNGMEYSERSLSGVLMSLVKKEKIRRWNTNAGFVYILAEKEAIRNREDVE